MQILPPDAPKFRRPEPNADRVRPAGDAARAGTRRPSDETAGGARTRRQDHAAPRRIADHRIEIIAPSRAAEAVVLLQELIGRPTLDAAQRGAAVAAYRDAAAGLAAARRVVDRRA